MDGYMEPMEWLVELWNMDWKNTSCAFDLNGVNNTVTSCPTGLIPSFNYLGWMDRMVEQGTSG